MFDGDASDEPEPSIEITALPVDPAYPKLRTVPPRPQLSYSVEQHREIVEGLIGDREHARYTGERIRYRVGLSSLPPPPAPEPDDAAIADAIVGDGQPAPASAPTPRADVPTVGYGDLNDPAGTDDASLGDFMRNMIGETGPTSPATAEPSSDDAPQPAPEGSSGVDPSPGMSAAQASHSSTAAPSGDRSATRLFAWIDDMEENAASAGTVPSPGPERASSRVSRASPPAGAVPEQAAAMSRHNGAEVEAARQVEVAAVSEPAPVMSDTNGNAQASPDDAGEPSPPTPAAAAVVVPQLKPETGPAVRPASTMKVEPSAGDGPRGDDASLATLTFAEGSAELPADATSRLEAALTSLEGDGVIEIVGRGEDMTLALDRARAVAVGLMRLGAGASTLKIAAEAAPAAADVRIQVGGRPPGN